MEDQTVNSIATSISTINLQDADPSTETDRPTSHPDSNPKPAKPNKKEKDTTKKMSKTKQKEVQRKEAARNGFSRYFSALYPLDGRWDRLLIGLEGPVRYCCVINKYADTEDIVGRLSVIEKEMRMIEWLKGISCVVVDDDEPSLATAKNVKPFPSPVMDLKNIKTHYLMDAASVLATDGLDIQAGDIVLDMCAAPGGKSFCMLQRLGPQGRLYANEMSNDRRTRLRKVLKEYIPSTILDTCVTITGFDGTKKESFPPNTYPKVLCDAPCSSERHVLHDEAELLQWSPSRTKNSAKRQRLLLAHALRTALDDGGRVVYATCSISRYENDMVVEKVLKRSPYNVHVATHDREWPIGEATTYGWIVLPDTVGRWGPLFFCVLEKRGRKDGVSGDGLDFDDD
ncbi:NOL1/NOP2/Sun domain member 3 [Chytriomyces hyalinus]|nr:NOL1/NOP2/Sun domain member 3 [Chytriomyces hyalinus]